MALDSELMAMGIPANPARAIGSNIAVTFAATGNNSQAAAAQIVNDYTIITTSGSSTNSVILPAAGGMSEVAICVASALTTVNVFPAVGQSIIDAGAQGAANAAVTLAATKQALFHPAGNTWIMIRGA